MLALSLLCSPADADPTLGLRVDTAYEDHLVQLAALLEPPADPTDTLAFSTASDDPPGEFQVAENTTADFGEFDLVFDQDGIPQADDGVVTIMSLSGDMVGTVWGNTVNSAEAESGEIHEEHWILHDEGFSSDPGAPFVMTMEIPNGNHLAAVNHMNGTPGIGDWSDDLYSNVAFNYTTKPALSQTGGMSFSGPQVTRYAFVIVQSKSKKCKSNKASQLPAYCTAGVMMREHHQVGGTEKFFEHWVFFDGFELLEFENDSVRVIAASGPAPATTGQFFDQLPNQEVLFYAQPNYVFDKSGADFEAL